MGLTCADGSFVDRHDWRYATRMKNALGYTLHGLKLDVYNKGVLPHQYAENHLFTNVQELAVQSIRAAPAASGAGHVGPHGRVVINKHVFLLGIYNPVFC